MTTLYDTKLYEAQQRELEKDSGRKPVEEDIIAQVMTEIVEGYIGAVMDETVMATIQDRIALECGDHVSDIYIRTRPNQGFFYVHYRSGNKNRSIKLPR